MFLNLILRKAILYMFLEGKKGLITGVANSLSLSWAIAKIARYHGADIAISYQSEILRKRVNPLAQEIGCDLVEICDVTSKEELNRLFSIIKQKWGKLDFLVHSIGFASKESLTKRYLDISVNDFLDTMNISCYSLIALSQQAELLMQDGGSILTLSYYGSQKVIPNYNIMGVTKAALETSVKYLAYDLGRNHIRVNAISAGPIKTLASSGIKNFKSMLDIHKLNAPLKRNITQEDIASSSLYLLSDLSLGVTGEVHFVDGGYNIMGV